MQENRHPSDPRNDLVDDHRHWEEVLYNCWQSDKNMYYLLHGIRCGGAALILSQRGYRLMSGEWNEAEWEDDIRQRLKPFKEKLVDIFKLSRVGRLTNDKLPSGFEKRPGEQERMFG